MNTFLLDADPSLNVVISIGFLVAALIASIFIWMNTARKKRLKKESDEILKILQKNPSAFEEYVKNYGKIRYEKVTVDYTSKGICVPEQWVVEFSNKDYTVGYRFLKRSENADWEKDGYKVNKVG